MSRQVLANRQRVEVCRNCLGSGTIGNEKCPVCWGAGMVKKTWEVKITIEPFFANKEINNGDGREQGKDNQGSVR